MEQTKVVFDSMIDKPPVKDSFDKNRKDFGFGDMVMIRDGVIGSPAFGQRGRVEQVDNNEFGVQVKFGPDSSAEWRWFKFEDVIMQCANDEG